MSAIPRSNRERLRAALLWAGDQAAAAGRSAGELYGLEGVRSATPEIVVPSALRPRSAGVRASRTLARDRDAEARPRGRTARRLAPTCPSVEIACEDARRRRLRQFRAQRTGPFGGARRARVDACALGRSSTRRIRLARRSRSRPDACSLRTASPTSCASSRSTWNGRTYFFDFCFELERVILEVNGRRWHDDAADYERDNEKWSVPGRLGYRIVFATWDTVTRRPERLLNELAVTLEA